MRLRCNHRNHDEGAPCQHDHPNLDDDLKARLRVQAARHGRSMEEEARCVLRDALSAKLSAGTGASWVADIRALVKPFAGIELELPPREPAREPPDFSGPEFGE